MAARKKSSARASTRGASAKGKARAKAVETAEVVEVEGGGMGIDEGIVFTTTLLLAAAMVFVWMALQSYPGS